MGDDDEVGKIFSLLACLESASPILAAPLLTYVYNSTLETFPGAVFVLLAAINALNATLLITIWGLLGFKRHWAGQDYGILREQSDNEEETREEVNG